MKMLSRESDVKKAVKVILMSTPKCWWFMPAMNGFGRSGIPDFVGHVNGKMFAVETKFGRGTTTVHQEREISAIRENGATAWVVNEETLEAWTELFREWVNGDASHP